MVGRGGGGESLRMGGRLGEHHCAEMWRGGWGERGCLCVKRSMYEIMEMMKGVGWMEGWIGCKVTEPYEVEESREIQRHQRLNYEHLLL